MQRHVTVRVPTAPHPFRERVVRKKVPRPARSDDQDLRLFALSFTAFFICIYTFIF